MQRHDLMALLGQLKLAGMRAHFGRRRDRRRKRQRSFEVILGELLRAEITDKQAVQSATNSASRSCPSPKN